MSSLTELLGRRWARDQTTKEPQQAGLLHAGECSYRNQDQDDETEHKIESAKRKTMITEKVEHESPAPPDGRNSIPSLLQTASAREHPFLQQPPTLATASSTSLVKYARHWLFASPCPWYESSSSDNLDAAIFRRWPLGIGLRLQYFLGTFSRTEPTR
ncbi:hypothetical protein BDP81DRAFT_192338 [Colletotrichum phormii]|uniref:Uncharacterized protein n=1 Tax=Colletotrichum phormii TaxID=359342 RepID=A0AAI9ZYF4_9PEZI|nr:uncharacterized protein BDP81DRAFT_192338 [Colletotrichum phormii]KAK1638837.1 hypothetical protein BDP81DRAFT_192338 [Colletotrichum phormii]